MLGGTRRRKRGARREVLGGRRWRKGGVRRNEVEGGRCWKIRKAGREMS